MNFCKKLEKYLNTDQELKRRLDGFKTFSGTPDGHYRRARSCGSPAIARAVKCYPFGGKSLLHNCEIVGINIKDGMNGSGKFVISLSQGHFSVVSGAWSNPHLTIGLSKDLFKKTILGRYRWLWLIGMEEVQVSYSQELERLPHSDKVTIFEVLVTMQELVEFDGALWQEVENL